jgi:hypothetical protein
MDIQDVRADDPNSVAACIKQADTLCRSIGWDHGDIVGNMIYDAYVPGDNDGRKQRAFAASCHHLHACRTPSNQIENYEECENAAFGSVYANCRHKDFG